MKQNTIPSTIPAEVLDDNTFEAIAIEISNYSGNYEEANLERII